MSRTNKIIVRLDAEQRRVLRKIMRTGTASAAMRRRAHILLKADVDGPDAWTDERIAAALDTSRMTVMRVRQQFAVDGLDATLHRKKPAGRQYRKLDGKQEAQLIAVACSKAPAGRARWTMTLLAQRLVELEVVDSIDPAKVWRTLIKTGSSRGSSSSRSPVSFQTSPRASAPDSRWRECESRVPRETLSFPRANRSACSPPPRLDIHSRRAISGANVA